MILSRITKIAARQARRHGAVVAAYAGATSFDVLTERVRKRSHDGMRWIKTPMELVYRQPAVAARSIRREILATWGDR